MPVDVQMFPNMKYGLLVFSNAANAQKATVRLESGSPLSYAANLGMKSNQLMSPPGATFTTGATGKISVDIQNSSDNRQWQASQLKLTSAGFGGGATPWMWLIASEDGGDSDYNDCVVIAYAMVG